MLPSSQVLRSVLLALSVGVVALAGLWLAASPALRSGGFLPHGVCYTWNTKLIALHVVSDGLIGLAYLSIPVAILYFTRRRRDLPFSWIFLLFGIFIVACGATHWMEVWTLWRPDYWLSGAIKAITAGASVPTAVALAFLIPKALTLPSRAELESAKQRLEQEVSERLEIEKELRLVQSTLELRVTERTRELQATNEELERQKASLRQADEAKDRFIAVMAHELRNPLHPIKLGIHLLKMQPVEDPNVAAAVSVIDRQVTQMTRLLDDLLDVARITQDRVKVQVERFPVWKAVEAAIESCVPMMNAKSQLLDARNEASHAWVNADFVRVAQVIGNVLNNASKFTGPGGRIAIALDTDDRGGVRVVVSDNGSGISEADLPHIFELFRRGTGRLEEGLGVGLGLAKRLIELHGGTIRASSEGIGKGATVEIRLPAARPAGAVMQSRDRAQQKGVPPLKLLIADDNRDGAETLASLLEMDGHEVKVVYDGQAAIEMLLSLEFDAALLDIGMPGASGHTVAQRVREQAPQHPVYLVAVTGYGTAADKERAKASGFDAHITKPADVAELRRLLAERLSRR